MNGLLAILAHRRSFSALLNFSVFLSFPPPEGSGGEAVGGRGPSLPGCAPTQAEGGCSGCAADDDDDDDDDDNDDDNDDDD